MKWTVPVVVGVLLLAALPARASDPVGVYALIEKVEMEPSDSQPERVRIWGVFSLAQGKGGDDYTPPTKGFIYFSLPKEKPENAKKEWNDLKKLAGEKTAVAFGSRYKLMAKVRTDKDITKDAVAYPSGLGVEKLPDSNPQAKALLAFKPKP